MRSPSRVGAPPDPLPDSIALSAVAMPTQRTHHRLGSLRSDHLSLEALEAETFEDPPGSTAFRQGRLVGGFAISPAPLAFGVQLVCCPYTYQLVQ